MKALLSHEELRLLAFSVLAGGMLVVVVWKVITERKRQERVAAPVDATKLRRKRLAKLGPEATHNLASPFTTNSSINGEPKGNPRITATGGFTGDVSVKKDGSPSKLRSRREKVLDAAEPSCATGAAIKRKGVGRTGNNNMNALAADEATPSPPPETRKSTPQSASVAPEVIPADATEAALQTTETMRSCGFIASREPSSDLPGWMELAYLLELLKSGPRAAYEALIGIACVEEVGNDRVWRSRGMGPAGPDTAAGVCRRWWDAAWGAGEKEAAGVAADVLGLHLDTMKDDLFSGAEEQRAALLLHFLGTSPSPLMVRRVVLKNRSAARATLRLAVAPVSGGGVSGAVAKTTASLNTTQRLEAWQPLEGLESLERLFRSAAGATALAAVLGLEADQVYAHGAEFETESVVTPLLGGLSCVLSMSDHLLAAQKTAGIGPLSSGFSLGNQSAQQVEDEAWEEVPVSHKLAKLQARLKGAGPRTRNALVHQYNSSLRARARNRQSFVELVEAALVKAMTMKGVASASKRDICAWFNKIIFLHESLPEMCDQRAPELLGGKGSTCASSGFLMSFSALLLRMGAGMFSSVRRQNVDSIDVGYVEEGSIKWESAPQVGEVFEDTDRPDEDVDGIPVEPPGEGPNNECGDRDEGSKDSRIAMEEDLHRRRREGAGGVEEEKIGESRGQQACVGHEHAASVNDAGERSGAADEARDNERGEKEHRRSFSFATELFFLTHRTLQVIVSSLDRRRGEMRKLISDNTLAKTGRSLDGEDDDGNTAAGGGEGSGSMASRLFNIYKETFSAITLGWALEGLGSDAITGHACQLANFTASWLAAHLDGHGLGENGQVSSLSVIRMEVSMIIPPLIETMCASWARAALHGLDEQFLSRKSAEDAALFCGKMMERVDLRLSVVTQNKLVEVLEALILTGNWALEYEKKGRYGAKARSGAPKGSMYWGNRRGFAGAILDSEELRRSLPRQLMRLYASVQAVEGLAAEHYLGYFKFGVRVRVGIILIQLWSHPLGEPRQVILDLVRASTAPALVTTPSSLSEAEPDGVGMSEGSSGGGATGGGHGSAVLGTRSTNNLATEFFKSSYDTITYFLTDSLDRLRDGVIEERGNGGKAIEAGHAHWNKYMSDRKAVVSGLKHTVLPVLTLLTTLGEERDVMNALRIGELGARSASLVVLMLRSLYGEESAAFEVTNPESWGFDKAELGRAACELLVGLTAHGSPVPTIVVAEALHHADPDFDRRLLEAAAAGEGGDSLRTGVVLEKLIRALKKDDERRKAEEEQVAAAATTEGGQGVCGGDPFEGLPEMANDGEEEDLVRVYEEAMEELVHTQVESLSPGHYFDSRREGSTLLQPRKVATEIMRKLPRMLPRPPHPASAVFAVVEEDALNFSRFVISGPVDSPYEGGLFVFDVFLPAGYPADPPLVQMITTGQGTVKFNVNLYADGKVCLSLLGKDSGTSSNGGDKWNPEKSSLWQVFASIQTQVLVKDPYYNEGGGRSNMRGRGTAETEEASAYENARVTLETIRHAAVANIRHPPKGCEDIIKNHFRALRNRILRRCKRAVDEAPDERIKRATLRASTELRAEMDKLLNA